MARRVETLIVTVNGDERRIRCGPDTSLLSVLRHQLDLKGSRFGCGLGLCGACVVMVDGQPVTSCDLRARDVDGRTITTVEGLNPVHQPLLQAFVQEQAAQCGYCLSGILVSASALLERDPKPNEDAVRAALDRHLCRCGAHRRIVRAVMRAARG